MKCDFQRVLALEFSSKDRLLVVGGGAAGESGSTAVIDWDSRRLLRVQTNFNDWVTCIAVDPSGSRFIAGSADSSVLIINFKSNAPDERKLVGHTGPVLAAAWSPDGKLIVTGSADRSLKVWAAEDGTLQRSFAHHTEAIHALAFRPQTEASDRTPAQCASGSDDQTVRIWQPTIGRMVRIIRGHDGPIFALGYTPDGKSLFSAGKEGKIRHLDPDSDRILGEWKAHDEPIFSLAIDSTGGLIATGDWSGVIKFWRFKDQKLEPHQR